MFVSESTNSRSVFGETLEAEMELETKKENKTVETKKYSYEEVYEASLKYFNGDELATSVFVDKYALKDNEKNYRELTPDDTHNRIAKEFARIDADKYGLDFDTRFKVYREALDKFARIVVQGSPMSAIGNPYQRMSASNCVVIASPRDDMESIVETGKELALLYKRRCGVGLDLSTLRPDGSPVSNAAGTTTGAWSFADFYSYITNMVGQKARRGALMLTMDVHHPDVSSFATCKHNQSKVTGANISVKLSDAFLKAVEKDTEYEQRWPTEGTPKISKQIKAREVWQTIIDSATQTGDPGLILWDNMLNNLPAQCYKEFKSVCVNPCSEIVLSAYDSCRLISINLTGYVSGAFTNKAQFDFDTFAQDVQTAMQMADNLVDIELELISRIKEVCETATERTLWDKLQKAGELGRRTGLGTHGLADTLAQLKIKYDSNKALDVVNKIYETFRNAAYQTSSDLARIRGPFPVYDFAKEKDCEFIKRLPPTILDSMKRYGRRNISLLTQAPTGSISIISKVGKFDRFNVSSGIEPVFRNTYTRRKKINPSDQHSRVDYVDEMTGDKWQEFEVYHSNVLNYLEVSGSDIKSKLPEYFITSDEIDWQKRIELQSKEGIYLDHSISSTINLPRETPSSVVGELYLSAWKKGLKGLTVYVEGSKSGVLVSKKERPTEIISSMAPKRPTELDCHIHQASVKGQKWTVLIGLLKNKPYEIFAGFSDNLSLPGKYTQGKIIKTAKGKYSLHLDLGDDVLVVKNIVQTFDNPESSWATRMVSTSLRHGVPVEFICEQLSKDGLITDVNKVLSRILKKYITDGTKQSGVCPGCNNASLIYIDGCVQCTSCPWSKCG